jgi:hypothetical protein
MKLEGKNNRWGLNEKHCVNEAKKRRMEREERGKLLFPGFNSVKGGKLNFGLQVRANDKPKKKGAEERGNYYFRASSPCD